MKKTSLNQIARVACMLLIVFALVAVSACQSAGSGSPAVTTNPPADTGSTDDAGTTRDTESDTQELMPIRFLLDWTPNTNHTGVYVASELGYYREAGLDVEIVQPGESSALSLVAAGRADFCVTFQEEIAAALTSSNPLPITTVATLIQHNTSGIISLSDRGIDSPADMAGHSYATWDTPIEKAILKALIEEDGGRYEDVEMIPNTVMDVVAALQTDIDMVWIYYAWDGIATELAGLDTNFIDFGSANPSLDFYTPVLASSNAFLEADPDAAARFLEATARGYQYAIEQPGEAAEILLKHAPELDRELVHASQLWLVDQYMAEVPQWGMIDQARWDRFFAWMYDNELIARPLEAGEGFTNDYLAP